MLAEGLVVHVGAQLAVLLATRAVAVISLPLGVVVRRSAPLRIADPCPGSFSAASGAVSQTFASLIRGVGQEKEPRRSSESPPAGRA